MDRRTDRKHDPLVRGKRDNQPKKRPIKWTINGQLHLNSKESPLHEEFREYAQRYLNSVDKNFYKKFNKYQIKKGTWSATNPSFTHEKRVELMVELVNLKKELQEVSGHSVAKKWIEEQIKNMINALVNVHPPPSARGGKGAS